MALLSGGEAHYCHVQGGNDVLSAVLWSDLSVGCPVTFFGFSCHVLHSVVQCTPACATWVLHP